MSVNHFFFAKSSLLESKFLLTTYQKLCFRTETLWILLVQKVIELSLVNYEIFFTNLYSTDTIFAVNEIKASTCAFSYSSTIFILEFCMHVVFLNLAIASLFKIFRDRSLRRLIDDSSVFSDVEVAKIDFTTFKVNEWINIVFTIF